MKTSERDIFSTAAALFESKGYHATSMKDIGKKLGIRPSALYNYINGKEELLNRVCFHYAEIFLHHIKKIEVKDISPVEKIEEILRFQMELTSREYNAVLVIGEQWKNMSENDRKKFLKLRNEYEQTFIEIYKSGDFTDVDPFIAMTTIFNAIRWISLNPGLKQRNRKIDDTLILIINAIS